MKSTPSPSTATVRHMFKVGDLVSTNPYATGVWESLDGKLGRVEAIKDLQIKVNWGFVTVYNTYWHCSNLRIPEEEVVNRILTKYSNG